MCITTGFNRTIPQQLKFLWRFRIIAPIMKRLQAIMACGLSPHKLALTLCIGSALGIMPLPWGTTLVCLLLAHVFRLNHIALQSLNYLLYPLQLALLIPFYKAGYRLFPWGTPVTSQVLSTLLRSPDLSSLQIFGRITLTSLSAWLVTALPAAVLVYGVMRLTLFRRAADV